jgi:molecular chaperone GrpE
LEKAVVMAKDVLEGRISLLSESKESLPRPSEIDALKGDKVMLIVADFKGVQGKGDAEADKTAQDAGTEKANESHDDADVSGTGTNEGGIAITSGLEAALAEERDKYLRLLAEYDNFRKRSFQDRENAAADAVARALDEMLSVTDNFERALSAECADPNYKKGVEMIYTLFKDSLSKLGIVEIEALGKPFDPNFHNAVTQRQDENFGDNTVCEVFQPGYTMGGRLIRCAMVAVANP